MNDSTNTLQDIYLSLKDDNRKLLDEIDNNQFHIDELNAFIKSYYDIESKNFSVFSPRSENSIYTEKIESEKELILEYEAKNKVLQEQKNKIQYYLDTIDKIIHSNNNNKNKQVKNSNLDILDIQEKERQRIARDLHDISLQNLAHLVHKLELVSLYMDKDIIQSKLELASSSKFLKEIINEIRNVVFDLRPMSIDDLGFEETLKKVVDDIIIEANKICPNMIIEYNINHITLLNDLVAASIINIIRECLNNTIKHSEATKVNFSIDENKQSLIFIINDNGKGFDLEETEKEKHFGLKIMKERVGLLSGIIDIDSKRGIGTKIQITIPCE